jgi:hypothetical protein
MMDSALAIGVSKLAPDTLSVWGDLMRRLFSIRLQKLIGPLLSLLAIGLFLHAQEVNANSECREEKGYQHYIKGQYDESYMALLPCLNDPKSTGKSLYWLGTIVRFARSGPQYSDRRREQVAWSTYMLSAIRGYEHGITGLASMVEQRAKMSGRNDILIFSGCLRNSVAGTELERKGRVVRCIENLDNRTPLEGGRAN